MLQRPVSHPSRRLRLVVETDDPALVISDFARFRDAGFDVVVCSGPDADHPCPALDGEPCAEIERADIVYNALRDPGTQAAVAEVSRRATDVPMVVSVATGSTEPLPDGCIPLTDTVSVNGQIDALRCAVLLYPKRCPSR